MIAGLVLLIIGLASIVLAVPLHAPALLLIGALIEGAGYGLAWMGSLALVNRVAPTEQRANVLASFYVATYLGVGIPVVGVGFLAGGIGLYPAVVAFALVIALLGLSLVAFIASKRNAVRQLSAKPTEEVSQPSPQPKEQVPDRSTSTAQVSSRSGSASTSR